MFPSVLPKERKFPGSWSLTPSGLLGTVAEICPSSASHILSHSERRAEPEAPERTSRGRAPPELYNVYAYMVALEIDVIGSTFTS